MIKEKEIKNKVEQYGSILSNNIFKIMEQKNMHESDIIKKAKDLGISISVGSISAILNGKSRANLETLIKLSEILGVKVSDLINESEVKKDEISNDFVTDINSMHFEGYIGQYHVYFFPTEETLKDKLLHGILEIGDFNENGTLKFTLDIRPREKNNKKSIKEYYGKVIISQSTEAIYCILEGKKQIEYSFLALHYQHLNSGSLENRMALALTISSGSERRPTVHRIYLTKRKIDKKEEQIIMGMLRLNSLEVMLSCDTYNEMINKENFSKEFIDFLNNHKKPIKNFSINLKDLLADNKNWNMIQEGLTLYNYVLGNKFHKVLKEEDEVLYKLFVNNSFKIIKN